jgi:hypothetical protein
VRPAFVTVLVFVLGSAFPTWGQDKVIYEVKSGSLIIDGGDTKKVEGGCYLDGPTCINVAKEKAALNAENESLKASIKEAPVADSPILMVAGAILLGFAGGLVVGHLAK